MALLSPLLSQLLRQHASHRLDVCLDPTAQLQILVQTCLDLVSMPVTLLQTWTRIALLRGGHINSSEGL